MMRRRTASAAALLAAGALAAGACGESEQPADAAGSDAGGDTGSDAGSEAGGGHSLDCPSQPPLHGSSCESWMIDRWCKYDECDENSLVMAHCDGQSWEVNYSLCTAPGCESGFEDPHYCWPGTLCVESSRDPECIAHSWHCPENPCVHEPLSCSCAGFLCGPFFDCVEAKAGHVLCEPKPQGPNEPVALTPPGEGGHSLTVNASHIYWIKSPDVWRVALTGGPPEKMASFSGSGYGQIALDDSYLYLGDATAGELRRRSLKSKAEQVLATGLPWVTGLAVNSTIVVWYGPTEMVAIPIAGGAATTLFDDGVGDVALDATYAFFFGTGAKVMSVPLAGGTATVLADGELGNQLTIDDTNVYVTQGNQYLNIPSGKVFKVPKTGGTPTVLAADQYEPTAILVDDTHVYYARDDSFINRLPKAGGAVEIVMTGYPEPNTLAMDASHIYFATQVSGPCGRIYMIAK